MSTSNQTHDHQTIKKWAEKRGGVPAKVKRTGKEDDQGVLRIHFPEHSDSDAAFEKISWDDFFENFDSNDLDFLYQDTKEDGETSTFHKFIARDR